MLAQENKTLKALEFQIDDKDVVGRIVGRLVHVPSGRSYHEKFRPPKKEMTDDVCRRYSTPPWHLRVFGPSTNKLVVVCY
jgi:hypothetical protein